MSTAPSRGTSRAGRVAAELFARALLTIEPEKIAGGSESRREWLGLVMQIQMYLYREGHDPDAFRVALLGIEEETA